MKTRIHTNPKNPEGLSVFFPYSPQDVETIKKVLGTKWDPKLKAWISDGPEILSDFQRLGIEVEWISPEARVIAERFRQQLWDTIDCRVLETGETFAYQQQGTEFLSLMDKAILGDDRGVGKSKQSLDAAAKVGANSILVLCTPKTVTYNWPQEVEKWQPGYSVGVVPDEVVTRRNKLGEKVLGRRDFWANPPQIVIANYEKLRLNDWPYDRDWDVLICDEITKAAKHSNTIVHKALKKIIKRSKYVWPLTGSPMEKNLTELYNIFSLIRPAVLGNYMRFRDQHLETDWQGGIVGANNLELLRERIGPYILRRTKKEVLHFLPPKLYETRFVKMTSKEADAYERMTNMFNPNLGISLREEDNALTQMLRMRQFCCTPFLFTTDLGKGSKFLELQDVVEDWPGQVLVFCFFEQVISLLHSWLGCHPDAMISGNVSAKQRIERIDAFNAGQLGKVMVSTDAGNAGVNITGPDLIVHYDQLFNNQSMLQREDRLHRLGQENPVTVMHLMCLDSIDYGTYLYNQEEATLFEEVIDGAEEQFLRRLDAPRLRKIVEGRS